MSGLTKGQLAALGYKPPEIPADMFAPHQADALLVAYGYLWLFQGDAKRDQNARFAFEARRQLFSLLDNDQRKRGIEIARTLAKANNLPFAEPKSTSAMSSTDHT
jgi:hypothetical protein